MDRHTLVMLNMDNQQESTVEHLELCLMLCGRLEGEGEVAGT